MDPQEWRINRLSRQLSNNKLKVQLTDQINRQLAKIYKTSTQVIDITNRLLRESEDLTSRQEYELHEKEIEKKIELRILEKRLQILKNIESNEVEVKVELISNELTEDNALMIGGRKMFVHNIEDNDLEVVVDTEVEDINVCEPSETPKKRMSDAIELQTLDTFHSIELEGVLNRVTPKRTGRKSVVPERYDWNPSSSKRFRRSNPMKEVDH